MKIEISICTGLMLNDHSNPYIESTTVLSDRVLVSRASQYWLYTESATVRLFFILSVLLCSVNKAGLKTETWLLYCLRLRSRSPHNAKHSTSYCTIQSDVRYI